jgi:hypothetical protein
MMPMKMRDGYRFESQGNVVQVTVSVAIVPAGTVTTWSDGFV